MRMLLYFQLRKSNQVKNIALDFHYDDLGQLFFNYPELIKVKKLNFNAFWAPTTFFNLCRTFIKHMSLTTFPS